MTENNYDIQSQIRRHSRTQLEIKGVFPLSSLRNDSYQMDVWIYCPGSLEISNTMHSPDFFLSSMKCLTRFSELNIPLESLIDPDCKISPLTRIKERLSSVSMPTEIPMARILYELRSLANIYRAEAKASVKIILEAIQDGHVSMAREAIKNNIGTIRKFSTAWRDLYGLFLSSSVSQRLRDAYSWADESISLTTEQATFMLYQQIQSMEDSSSIIKRLKKLIDKEREHRETMGYQNISPEMTELEIERRIYRESVLKKWSHSVLYLSQEESIMGRQMNQVVAGFAAAVAMGFAVTTTLVAQKFFPQQGLAWAVAITVAYIFKDRIKETLRNVLNHMLPGLIADKRVKLVDQSNNQTVGTVKSRVQFLTATKTPQAVEQVRTSGEILFRSLLPEENVIHFQRDIRISTHKLRKNHTRLSSLTDICRYNIDDLFTGMDSSTKSIPIFTDDAPARIKGNRVYHLNLVVKFSNLNTGQTDNGIRYRLVVNRSGIVRIKQFS